MASFAAQLAAEFGSSDSNPHRVSAGRSVMALSPAEPEPGFGGREG